jgi:hypothetical protein
VKRHPRIDDLSDESLLAFVLWCRLNDDRITSMPDLVRRVLHAYAGGNPNAFPEPERRAASVV